MKQISISELGPVEQRAAISEVHIMADLSCPYVVRYFDSFIEASLLCIVMEACEGGDLQKFLKRHAGAPLPEPLIWSIFLQVTLGLAYLHSRRTLHRDLKSANIFISGELTPVDGQHHSATGAAAASIKIGDLGVARVLGTESAFAKTCVGTPYYLSPELCEDRPYNEKSDVWALGCVLYEMSTGKHPFDARNQGALILKIIQGKYPPLDASKYSRELITLVDSLLERDTRRRPTCVEVLARPDVAARALDTGLQLPQAVLDLVLASRQSNNSSSGDDDQDRSGLTFRMDDGRLAAAALPHDNEEPELASDTSFHPVAPHRDAGLDRTGSTTGSSNSSTWHHRQHHHAPSPLESEADALALAMLDRHMMHNSSKGSSSGPMNASATLLVHPHSDADRIDDDGDVDRPVRPAMRPSRRNKWFTVAGGHGGEAVAAGGDDADNSGGGAGRHERESHSSQAGDDPRMSPSSAGAHAMPFATKTAAEQSRQAGYASAAQRKPAAARSLSSGAAGAAAYPGSPRDLAPPASSSGQRRVAGSGTGGGAHQRATTAQAGSSRPAGQAANVNSSDGYAAKHARSSGHLTPAAQQPHSHDGGAGHLRGRRVRKGDPTGGIRQKKVLPLSIEAQRAAAAAARQLPGPLREAYFALGTPSSSSSSGQQRPATTSSTRPQQPVTSSSAPEQRGSLTASTPSSATESRRHALEVAALPDLPPVAGGAGALSAGPLAVPLIRGHSQQAISRPSLEMLHAVTARDHQQLSQPQRTDDGGKHDDDDGDNVGYRNAEYGGDHDIAFAGTAGRPHDAHHMHGSASVQWRVTDSAQHHSGSTDEGEDYDGGDDDGDDCYEQDFERPLDDVEFDRAADEEQGIHAPTSSSSSLQKQQQQAQQQQHHSDIGGASDGDSNAHAADDDALADLLQERDVLSSQEQQLKLACIAMGIRIPSDDDDSDADGDENGRGGRAGPDGSPVRLLTSSGRRRGVHSAGSSHSSETPMPLPSEAYLLLYRLEYTSGRLREVTSELSRAGFN